MTLRAAVVGCGKIGSGFADDPLLKGDVFTKDQIDAYIELLWGDVSRWETTPSAVEYDMYFSS